ncbi:MAG: helix-turn-helix transcriptional regulator [Clostridia bacterium]|nr:helix-turn-helix transcriptional regulator [Clostridia bacterium]
MFFKTNDINVNLLSSLELKHGFNNSDAGVRPYHALSFRIDGNANFKHNGKVTHAKTGDILFAPAYCRYTIDSCLEHLFVLHFESDTPLPTDIQLFSPDNPSYFKRKFEELHKVWSKKQPGYIYECKSIFYRILMHIEQEYMKNKYTGYQDKLNEAVDYIHEHFTAPELSVEMLAKMSAMSGTYFRKMFREKLSVSPRHYINMLKLELATELLSSGYYTVSEASEKCGFKNIHYFSAFIKKETGKSPSHLIPNK